MADKNIFQIVCRILVTQLSVDPAKISERSTLGSDLGADSLDLAEISLMIKDEFQYDLSEAEMTKIRTVGDICEILGNAVLKERS